MKVNSNLLPMKAHYFFVFAATAPMLPFLPLVGRQLGIQSGIPLVYTVLPFVGILAKFFAGGVADAKGVHKNLLLGALCITTLGFFSIYFAPGIPKSSVVTVSTNLSLDCSPVASYLRHRHTKEPCGRHDYLATIAEHTLASCTVQCSLSEDSINDGDSQDLCKAWNISLSACQGDLSFTSTIDLYHGEREGTDTYIPIVDVSIFNSTRNRNSDTSVVSVRDRTGTKSSGNGSTNSDGLLDHPVCLSTVRVFKCTGVCQNPALMQYLDAPEVPPTLAQILHYPQFWIFMSLMLVAWSSFASVVTLSDTICFMLIGRHGGEYGRQRVWGSIGWGFCVMLAGALIDTVSGSSADKDYTPAFLLTLALFIMDIASVTRIRLPRAGEETSENTPGPKKSSVMSSCLTCGPLVMQLLSEPRVVVFVISCIVVGASTGALWTYQLMLVEEVAITWNCDFHWIKLLDGLMLGVQCFMGELPFFLLAGVLLKKLGHVMCMTIVIATFGLRFVLYSFVWNPWMFLPIEVLQGLTFGLFYTTMASYASVVARPGTEATMQAMVGAAFEGVGIAIGGSMGGAIFFQYGGQTLFLVLGIFNLIFSVVFAATNWGINKCQPDTAAYHTHYPVLSAEPITSELSSSDAAPVLMRS
uniref:Major facilitator superfamily domain-containing protein 6-like n=2 Tax=Hirondellea gigas TaxID=1518452 RepID=A0A6A7G897_9CRUS